MMWRLSACFCVVSIVSDIAIFVLKRDVKLQLTNCEVSNCTAFSHRLEVHIVPVTVFTG